MSTVGELLKALDERTVAQKVGIPHDEVRAQYPLRKNTVTDFEEFTAIIGDYFNHHFTRCVSHGGSLSSTDAQGRAKEIIVQEYRRRHGDISTAFNDAHDGTNGGLRRILDVVAESLKAESVEIYTREMFDRYVTPNDWDQKVEIIREFIAQCGVDLSSLVDTAHPERYARSYVELISAYVNGRKQMAPEFRRL